MDVSDANGTKARPPVKAGRGGGGMGFLCGEAADFLTPSIQAAALEQERK